MDELKRLEEQVQENLPKLHALAEQRDRLWLTFYLSGPPERLHRLASSLAERGWINVDGWEGGFLYPKVQVENSLASMLDTARLARQLCAESDAQIVHIDADTTADEHSRFETLYHAPD